MTIVKVYGSSQFLIFNLTYMVLYRKYRPQKFSEVVGQEHIVKTLTNALKRDILAHGYLFAGPHGTGKTTLARLLAKSLNCQNRKTGQAEPCCKCDSCLEIKEGKAIDLIEIDAASNRGIDDIRELKEGIGFVPAKSKYKVFIIGECHQLSKEAANALLKTLEEPPSHAIFIMATTELHKMIATILSRCQTFVFHKLTQVELLGLLETTLKKEGIKYEKEALEMLCFSSHGAARDAQTLLDQAMTLAADKLITKEEVKTILGLTDKKAVFEFLSFLSKKEKKEALELVNKIYFEGIDLAEFLSYILAYLRLILILQIDDQTQAPLFLALNQEEKEMALKISQEFEEKRVKLALEVLLSAENKIKFASIPQLPIELSILDICQ